MNQYLRLAFSAVLAGDLQKLENSLIQIGNVNEGTGEQTLLHAAAESGNLQVIQYLLSKNANPNAVNRNGMTPLQVAIERQHIPAFLSLMRAKANIESADASGARALHWAVQSGNQQITEELIQAKADVGAKAKFDSTPLHIAARAGSCEVIRILINANATIDCLSKNMSALHIAAMKGNLPVIKELINLNASIEIKTSKKWTPLHVAASTGKLEAVQFLIESNAHLSAIDYEGNTPADLARVKGYQEIIEAIDAGEKAILSQFEIKPPPETIGLALLPYTKELFQDQHRSSDLSFLPGTVITDIEQHENGWWEGVIDGTKGFFPSNYVSVKFLGRAKCKSAYYAANSDELTIKPNDELDIYERRPSGWVRVICNGKGGLVPPSHIREQKNIQPSPRANTTKNRPISAKFPTSAVNSPLLSPVSSPVGSPLPVFQNKPTPMRVASPAQTRITNIPAPLTSGAPPPPNTIGPPPGALNAPRVQKSPARVPAPSFAASIPTQLPSFPVHTPAQIPQFPPSLPVQSSPQFSSHIPVQPPSLQIPVQLPTVTKVTQKSAAADSSNLFDVELDFGSSKKPIKPSPPTTPALPKARVLYAYEAQHEGDLELTVGTTVEILKMEGGWWEGTFQGNTGIFPANYVELL